MYRGRAHAAEDQLRQARLQADSAVSGRRAMQAQLEAAESAQAGLEVCVCVCVPRGCGAPGVRSMCTTFFNLLHRLSWWVAKRCLKTISKSLQHKFKNVHKIKSLLGVCVVDHTRDVL